MNQKVWIAATYLFGTSLAFGLWQGWAAGVFFFGAFNLVALVINHLRA